MKTAFSKEAEKALRFAEEEAARTGSMEVLPGHLLLGLLRERECAAAKAAALAGADLREVKSHLEEQLMGKEAVKYGKKDEISFSLKAELALAIASSYAESHNAKETGSLEILVGLLRSEDRVVTEAALAGGISEESLARAAGAAAGLEAMLRSAIQPAHRQTQDQARLQAGQESGETSQKKPLN